MFYNLNLLIILETDHIGIDARKPIFGISDQVRLYSIYSATGSSALLLFACNKGRFSRVAANYMYEPRHEISNNVVCVTSKASNKPGHMLSLIRNFAIHLHIL